MKIRSIAFKECNSADNDTLLLTFINGKHLKKKKDATLTERAGKRYQTNSYTAVRSLNCNGFHEECLSVIYCCLINCPKTQRFRTTINIYFVLQLLWEQFRLGSSGAGSLVRRQPGCQSGLQSFQGWIRQGWVIYSYRDSHSWLASWCWLLLGILRSSICKPLPGTLEGSHDMATRVPQSQRFKKKKKKGRVVTAMSSMPQPLQSHIISLISYWSHGSALFNVGEGYRGASISEKKITGDHFGDWLPQETS